jgi:predicted ATPase/DNA-binding XRE family transcriptional regulator
MTQEQLAERAELSPEAVAALERGARRRPYPHIVQALAGALGLSDAERVTLLEAVPKRGVGDNQEVVPAPTPPIPLTPLVGRERELVEIDGLLRGRTRLVTLTGPGGVGKTRLALEVASRVADVFREGVAFVPLAPLSDPALVLPTVARMLGLMGASGRPVLETLLVYLRAKRLVLVLDNFEHVMEAAPEVAELLAGCPDVAVLATSRAPLRLRGEREYPVGPLPVPEMDRLPLVTVAAESPAVELLMERASGVALDFELTRSNVAAVVAICRRLDGLPLALELAAARVRALDPTAMLARLDQALPLLRGGARDLPERQRTMEAAIGWSYDLLGPEERAPFRRLSVFSGGWNLDAAESAGSSGETPSDQVLELLT